MLRAFVPRAAVPCHRLPRRRILLRAAQLSRPHLLCRRIHLFDSHASLSVSSLPPFTPLPPPRRRISSTSSFHAIRPFRAVVSARADAVCRRRRMSVQRPMVEETLHGRGKWWCRRGEHGTGLGGRGRQDLRGGRLRPAVLSPRERVRRRPLLLVRSSHRPLLSSTAAFPTATAFPPPSLSSPPFPHTLLTNERIKQKYER